MALRLTTLVFMLCALGSGQENRVLELTDYPYRYGRMTPSSIYTADCSATSQAPPNSADASPEDFVELERDPCFSECPFYRVRLYRSGRIEWQFGPQILGEGGAVLPAADASKAETLLNKVHAPEFWSACETNPAAEDSAIYNVRLSIGNQRKSIQAAYGNGLEWLDEFTSDLDRVVETHRWFRGDRAMGEISHLMIAALVNNSGATSLMRAAASGDLDGIAKLLAEGVPVNEQDANGWTALVYAAGAFQLKALESLLNAGADPDVKDLHGHTPLMASAYGVGFEEILPAARDVNYQSDEGLSALMVLAGRANLEKVRLALAHGADRTARNRNGQTAWDYLMHSYCGPVLDSRILSRLPGASPEGRQQCLELDRLLSSPLPN